MTAGGGGRCSKNPGAAPVLKYAGSKWGISDWLASRMPPHESYLEPFMGSLAVLFKKAPSPVETVNDLDGQVVRFFRTLREQPEALARAVALTPYSREEYYAARVDDAGKLDDVEAARQLLVNANMAISSKGTTGKKSGWKRTSGLSARHELTREWQDLPQKIRAAALRLKRVQIECRPALEILPSFSDEKVLIYADPPYLMRTRSAGEKQYKNEMTDADHAKLLEALIASKSMVMVSGYESELYMDTLAGWTREQCVTHDVYNNKKIEMLWMNRACVEGAAQLRMDI